MLEVVRESRRVYGYGYMEQGEDHDMAPYSPWFAYRQYCDSRREAGAERRADLYVSLAITSGGYRRDEAMPIPEVIAQNTDYGAALRELFESHGIASRDIVIPSELGAMRNASWGQLDFLMLWFHAMAGLSVVQALEI